MAETTPIVIRPSILDGFDHSAYWIRSVSSTGSLELALVAKATCEVSIGGRAYLLRQGAVALVDPGHDLVTTRRGRGSRYSGLLFDWADRRLVPADANEAGSGLRPRPGQPDQPTWSSILGRSVEPILPADLARAIAPQLALEARRWWQGTADGLRATALLCDILARLVDWAQRGAEAGSTAIEDQEFSKRAHAWVRSCARATDG
jgi:hypothetical protein